MLAHTIEEMGLVSRVPAVHMDGDAGRSLATRTGTSEQRHIQMEWLPGQDRGGELQVRRVDGEQNGSDLGTRHLDARRREYLMNLRGLKMGRRQTSSMQVGMVACLTRAADAAGEIVISGQLTDDSTWLMHIILVTLMILAMVGTCTLWRAAFPVGRRSVGSQTDEGVQAGEAPTRVTMPRISTLLYTQSGGHTLQSWHPDWRRRTAGTDESPSTAGSVSSASHAVQRAVHSPPFITQLENYTVFQLKSMCRARGLCVAGLKRDHILRLEEHGR